MTQYRKNRLWFFLEDVADTYRNSDIEVVKKIELKTEETIHQKIANTRT
jgi:hypothetical protein